MKQAASSGPEMPFYEHLRALRSCVVHTAAAVGVGFVIAYPFARTLFSWLTQPLNRAWVDPGIKIKTPQIIYTGPMEVFIAFMKLSFVAGLVLASPYIFFQLWRFLSPALRNAEKRLVLPFVFFTTLLFLTGGIFGYFVVIPAGYGFFLQYAPEYISPQIRVSEYLSITSGLLLACGASFEFPVLVIFLIYLRLLKVAQLARNWRVVVIALTLAAAILTPSTDMLSMILLTIPLVILYGLSLGVGFFIERGRRQ